MTDSPEIAIAGTGELDDFWRTHDRDWRSEAWNFRVVWHEARYDIGASNAAGLLIGGLRVTVAASLAVVDALYVMPTARRSGIGRALLERCEDLGKYYNAHKVTVAVQHESAAEHFFLSCGYHEEAVLRQHTFKLDVAMLRKFLL